MQASVRVSVRARVWAAHLVARHGEEVLLDLLLQLGEAGLLLHFEAQPPRDVLLAMAAKG